MVQTTTIKGTNPQPGLEDVYFLIITLDCYSCTAKKNALLRKKEKKLSVSYNSGYFLSYVITLSFQWALLKLHYQRNRASWRGRSKFIIEICTDYMIVCRVNMLRNIKCESATGSFFSIIPILCSWNFVSEQCGTQNASLADINSKNEAVWLEDFSRQHSGIDFWIGGKRDQGIFKWFTHDGQTKNMNYTRWAKDISLLSYKCVELWHVYQYKWYTYGCHMDYNFICKTYL
ncbi:Hypothetical predicted protein [Mytilus galloprovincialis]|uniref:C-type lectin domain-containing protein n=1 Tax=Mytilus galloprovincialis TaxID=29158 RepID=A0A8B6DHC6_MYTGA|nr:Hypothetical predicted protein [Mytilus galloprovincialis]